MVSNTEIKISCREIRGSYTGADEISYRLGYDIWYLVNIAADSGLHQNKDVSRIDVWMQEAQIRVKSIDMDLHYTVCPTRYRTRHFFNNSNTNEDIATKFEQEYVRCVRNEEEFVCSPLQISLQYPH